MVPQLLPVTLSSSKSKTPCYFFSQGYCAKEDKCPFMHGAPAACRANAALSKSTEAGLNGKAVQGSGRALIVPKQTAATYGRPDVSIGFDTSSKVPITCKESTHVASGLQVFNSPESNGFSAPSRQYNEIRKLNAEGNRLYGSNQNELGLKREQGLQYVSDNQGKLVRAADLKRRCEVDASRGRIGRGHVAVQSDSHSIVKSLSNSSASNVQDSSEPSRSDDSGNWESQSGHFSCQYQVFSKHVESPRVSHNEIAEKCKKQKLGIQEQDASSPDLCKRQNRNSLYTVSDKLNTSRGQTDFAICGRGSHGRLQERSIQQERKLAAQANIDEVIGAKVNGRENSVLLQRASSNKVFNTDKCLLVDNKQCVSSGGISKKESLNFAGPKSLAQIKAEKMAGRESASEAVGKQVTTGSSDKLTSSPKKSIDDKQKTAMSTAFEGPKPLSALLKRKRELDLNGNVSGTMSEPSKAEVPVLDSCRELEDGEVGDESDCCEEESLPSTSCPSVSVKEDSQAISSSSREVLQRVGAEAAEFDVDLSEELKSDAEMEDVADYNIGDDNEDDDDDEDFAKKLGRFFALSSE